MPSVCKSIIATGMMAAFLNGCGLRGAEVPSPPSAKQIVDILETEFSLERHVQKNKKENPRALWTAYYANEEGKLPTFTISLYRRGDFFTPERETGLNERYEQIEMSIAELEDEGIEDARADFEKTAFRRKTLPNGEVGYGFIGGFGPGGTVEVAACRSGNARFDLVVEISRSHLNGKMYNDWYEKFQETGPLVVAERILIEVDRILVGGK